MLGDIVGWARPRAGALQGVWRWIGTRDLPDSGYVTLSDASRYDTVHQRVHPLLRCEQYEPDGMLSRTFQFRLELAYLYPADIRSLRDRTGFELIRMSGSFAGRPLEHDGDELVVEARRRR